MLQAKLIEAELAHAQWADASSAEAQKAALSGLAPFIRYTFPGYQWNWHHEVICQAIADWLAGGCRNMALYSPPAHGKTEIVSRRLPAFLFALIPGVRIIASSYGAETAEGNSRDVQAIMADARYVSAFGRMFQPGLRRTAEEFHVRGGGRYACAGVGGPLIGKHFDIGLIDDPIKNAEEAFSPTARENLWQWYTRVWSNRKRSDKAKELIIMHRWHEDDLVGRILKDKPADWRVVNLEAIATQESEHRKAGQALWPQRFSLEFLLEQKRKNPHAFSALYQGRPVAEGGGMFKRVHFRYAERGQGTLFNLGDHGWRDTNTARRYITVDPAFSTKDSGDYTVIMAWAMWGEVLLLLDVLRDRFEGGDIPAQIALMLNRHRATEAWVEKIGAQTMLIQDAARKGLPVRELRPDKDKATRAAPMAAAMANEKVWFAPGPWQPELENELLAFPAGAHDDQVDAFSYGERVRHEIAGWTVTREALY